MPSPLRVHPKYIEEVNLAWKRKSDGREQDLAQELGRSLYFVISNLFLKGEPVNELNFVRICQTLELNWREIAGLDMNERDPVSLQDQENFGSLLMPKPQFGMEATALDEAINHLVSTLCEMLRHLTRKAGTLLCADRTSIFLIDPQRKELGSLIAEDGKGGSLMIDVPLGQGIAGRVATSGTIINVPFDLYADLRSEQARITDQKTGYRTYSILAWPLLNGQKELIAVVQLINKLKRNYNPQDNFLKRMDTKGFTKDDEAMFARFAPSILQTLERCQFCYQLTQKLKNNESIDQFSSVSQKAQLVAKLKREEQQLRESLKRIEN
ncbi:MAG: GAF domain-containing protein [Symploca sp. SIO2E6]|nr:GAF domain-containing protein [Symploca sp. SIO2E6]